jgi:hypothetical protein
VFVSVRLTLGTLISGALATQSARVAASLVPPEPFAGDGSGKTVAGGLDWLNTLLGPEETDRLGGRHRRVMASGFARPRVGWASFVLVCGITLRPHRLVPLLPGGARVSGGGVDVIAVCCLRFA